MRYEIVYRFYAIKNLKKIVAVIIQEYYQLEFLKLDVLKVYSKTIQKCRFCVCFNWNLIEVHLIVFRTPLFQTKRLKRVIKLETVLKV